MTPLPAEGSSPEGGQHTAPVMALCQALALSGSPSWPSHPTSCIQERQVWPKLHLFSKGN